MALRGITGQAITGRIICSAQCGNCHSFLEEALLVNVFILPKNILYECTDCKLLKGVKFAACHHMRKDALPTIALRGGMLLEDILAVCYVLSSCLWGSYAHSDEHSEDALQEDVLASMYAR